MTTRIGAAIAAGSLAVGILVGAAGTIVARDATTTDLADHMRGLTASAGSMGHMAGMMSMMDGSHMAGMMSMMDGAGSSMMPNASMAPDASTSPEDHVEHHASPSPAATR
jgi:hypothetical protein